MKYYAVANGKSVGIFESWNECDKQVSGYGGAIFKSFKNRQDAEEYLKKNVQNDEVKTPKDDVSLDKKTIERKIEPKNMMKRTIESIYGDQSKSGEKSAKMIKNDTGKKYVHVYVDGACSNNGNEMAMAGIGVYFEGGEYNDISKRIHGVQTNNRAELLAILEAIQTVRSEDDIVIYTDSEYSLKGISGINRIHKNSDLFQKIASSVKSRKGETRFEKVKGHTGNYDGNHMADTLATKSLLI